MVTTPPLYVQPTPVLLRRTLAVVGLCECCSISHGHMSQMLSHNACQRLQRTSNTKSAGSHSSYACVTTAWRSIPVASVAGHGCATVCRSKARLYADKQQRCLTTPPHQKAPISGLDSLSMNTLPSQQNIWCIHKISGRQPLSLGQVITLVGNKILAPTTRPTLMHNVRHLPLFGAINQDRPRTLRRPAIASHMVAFQQTNMKGRMQLG